jgi:adenine-specific DNA-methyltransferase
MFRGFVKLIYIDPPYNTGGDGFLYRDEFSRHSAWLSLMEPRLRLGRELLSDDGAIFIAIDDNEHANLKQTLDMIFGADNHITSMVWEGGLKNDSRYISVGQDYMVGYFKESARTAQAGIRWRVRKEGIDEIYNAVNRLRVEHGHDYMSISQGLREWYRRAGKSHPSYAHRHYNSVDERGAYFPGDIAWPGGGGPSYDVFHPVTGQPVKKPTNGWRYSTPERMAEMIAQNRIHFDADHTTVPKVKRYLQELEGQVLPSVFYRDRRAAIRELRDIMGGDVFDNPKDVLTIQKLVEATTVEDSWIADFFAGSGTTGHAVIALNRELGSNRRFFMVEMGEYFDSVLKRRIAKVMYAPEWKGGQPSANPSFSGELPEWVNRSPRVVQILGIEAYEDSLNSLTTSDATALFAQPMLRYTPSVSDQGPACLLATNSLEDPFQYELQVQTPTGSQNLKVDLVTTFYLMKGIHPTRYRELEHDGRRYVLVEGVHATERVLVLWRDIASLDPEAEREFLLRTVKDVLDVPLAEYRRVYHNADSALPNGLSLDQEFKQLMFEPESALA